MNRDIEDIYGAVRYWENEAERVVHLEIDGLRPGQRLLITNLSKDAKVQVDEPLGAWDIQYRGLLEFAMPRDQRLLVLCGTGL